MAVAYLYIDLLEATMHEILAAMATALILGCSPGIIQKTVWSVEHITPLLL